MIQLLSVLVFLLAVPTIHSSQLGTQNPPVFFFSVGSTQAAAIFDGPAVFPGNPFTAPDDAVFRSYKAAFRPAPPFRLSMTPVLLETPAGRVLVDTGAIFTPEFPPFAGGGNLIANLQAIGVDPASIQHIFLTHGHAGHASGLVDEFGVRTFPNATVYVTEIEHDFWLSWPPSLDDLDVAPEAIEGHADVYRRNIYPYLDDLVFVEESDSPLEGFEIVLVPGHTPGHIAVKFTSNGQSVLFIGDAWISKPDQVQNPDWFFSVDTGRLSGYEQRIRLFEMAVEENLLVHAFHEPFPGLGFIRKDGAFFDWEQFVGQNISLSSEDV